MSDKTKNILEWVVCIVIAVVLAIFIRHFLITPTIVQQESMFPTLVNNERLILNRWGRTFKQYPSYGDIVTFEAPSKLFVTKDEVDEDYPVAKYEDNPTNIFSAFTYYVLEIGKKSFIKRVIGLPGDHIEIKNGMVYRNGQLLDEPYLQSGVRTDPEVSTDTQYSFTDIVVPEGTVYCLGDNRTRSTDCRAFGCIPLEKIEGTVVFRFWPLSKFGGIK